ncbi:DUF1444 domain-containing protein [Pueribacillus theae]
MKRKIEKRLSRSEWRFSYNKNDETMRIEDIHTKKGMTLSLNGLLTKWEENKDTYFDELIEHIEEAMKAMNEEQRLSGKEKAIFPVIRSTSFPTESNAGKKLIHDKHTAETAIFYALDLGKSYRLIDEGLLKEEGWEESMIKEAARFNLRSLDVKLREDTVAGNTFYFLNTNDGYDASRILNQPLLESMAEKAEGTLAIAVPHQDVLIFADIHNDTGYDVLGQMTMSFFASGRVPITALPFLYNGGELEPIFILAKNRPQKDK